MSLTNRGLLRIPEAGAAGPTVIFEDSFTGEISPTNLDSHTPDTTGTGWTKVIDSAGLVTLQATTSDTMSPSANDADDSLSYAISPAPTSADVEAEWDIINDGPTGSDDPFWALLRYQDANNYICIGHRQAGGTTSGFPALDLVEVVSGTATRLDSLGDGNNTYDIAVGDVVRAQVIGTTAKLFVNDIERLSATVSITNAGGVCAGFGNLGSDNRDDIGAIWEIGYFKVTEGVS